VRSWLAMMRSEATALFQEILPQRHHSPGGPVVSQSGCVRDQRDAGGEDVVRGLQGCRDHPEQGKDGQHAANDNHAMNDSSRHHSGQTFPATFADEGGRHEQEKTSVARADAVPVSKN